MESDKILEAAATAFIKEISNEIKVAYSSVASEARQLLELGISEYITKQYERIRTIKTILKGSTPSYFYDIYHPINITNHKHKAHTHSLDSTFEKTNHITIIGDAGSGKSTLAKHLFLRALNEKKSIPIFIELRYLENTPNAIENHIKEKILENKLSESSRILKRMLDGGRFLFFFDGYDEISGDHKKNITHSINRFTETHQKNRFILTTRPYTDIDLLPLFHNYHIESLKESEIDQFIDKQLRDETELAEKIKKSVKETKSSYIKSFLKNPLLLSLYILTYQSNPSVPTKKYLFYRRVINALFSEHDSKSKLGFERKIKCGLPQEETEKILKAFCFLSYFDEAFSFEHDDLVARLESVKERLVDPKFKTADFISDMKVAVSLWIEDGGITSFAHRSLQEYFAALFIKELDEKNKEIVYSKITSNSEKIHTLSEVENFLSLCEEMDEVSFNKNYALPILIELRKKITGRDSLNKLVTFFLNGFTYRKMLPKMRSKQITPHVSFAVYKSLYFHLPFTLRLHRLISKIDPAHLFPDQEQMFEDKSYHLFYLNKTKGLKARVINQLREAGADALATQFLKFLDDSISKRSEMIESQKRSNSEFISLVSL